MTCIPFCRLFTGKLRNTSRSVTLKKHNFPGQLIVYGSSGRTFFVQTMDVDSVQKWEQVLHIRAKPLTETLSFRRQRILSRLCTRPPFTLAFLHQQLDALLGVGRWTCRVDYPAYLLTIGTHVEDKLHREELIHMVNQIKPAHIVFGMYLFCDPVEAYAYAAAAPCGTSILASVRMPEIKKEDTQ